MIRELNVDELLDVLHELDEKLPEPIVIRAVGGFALAWHDIRKEGLTADVDTLTDDYPERINRVIAEVGRKHNLDPWWLNNDAAADDAEFLIESMGLRWEKADCGFKSITLYVADLESLLKLKLSAVEDSALSGRARDLDDTVRLLRALGYERTSFRRKFAYLQEDMPNAYRMISQAIW